MNAQPLTLPFFVDKWRRSRLKERASSHEHFLDLCHLLNQPTPAGLDGEGSLFTFEKGLTKLGGRRGFADVWFRHRFAWEYKGKHKDLSKAYEQLCQYREALENPPLLIVSDIETTEIHTNFTGTAKQIHLVTLDDLQQEPAKLHLLRRVFTEPDSFKPGTTVEEVTQQVARQMGELAERLRQRGHQADVVAHFISKLLFCLFAEDVRLLPDQLIGQMLQGAEGDPSFFTDTMSELFDKMSHGGRLWLNKIEWFNGGLFDDAVVLPLEPDDLRLLKTASEQDWSQVEPSIFGTLFERGLDPNKRSQLGAHYTPRSDIERVVRPVVMEPLEAEWQTVKDQVNALLEQAQTVEAKGQAIPANLRTRGRKGNADYAKLLTEERKIRQKAATLIREFLDRRVRAITVLDPACGSGNFLYVAMELLHDLEKQCLQALREVEHNQGQIDIRVGPWQFYGLELNPYAHELAQVTVWIGHLQWMLRNGFAYERNPILKDLDNIQCRDALVDLSDPIDPKPTKWPSTDCIVGNPPFLGDKKFIRELGEDYTSLVRKVYKGRVPGQADLVCYWFEQARALLDENPALRVGLVATNSIRGGKNRVVLEQIAINNCLFNAWKDEPWIVDGAAVRISLVCFTGQTDRPVLLDNKPVGCIYPDLTAFIDDSSDIVSFGSDLTSTKALFENKGTAFIGPQKNGAFDISGEMARQWLLLPSNPNGYHNREVLKPWLNGMDITRRPADRWIIDFVNWEQNKAAFFELPFEHVATWVKPERINSKTVDTSRKERWWLHGRTGDESRSALVKFRRYIATPRVSKYRLFCWIETPTFPDAAVVAISRDDDTTFGILHSKFHELWSLKLCTWLGKGNDPRYTPTTCFATFPFPDGLTPNVPASAYKNDLRAMAIAEAAMALDNVRNHWLNPPEWVDIVPEVVPGYPDRILPKDADCAAMLKQRTLTNLYNQRPAWLTQLHRALDEAVCMAYGWPLSILDDEQAILNHLFALNQARASYQNER